MNLHTQHAYTHIYTHSAHTRTHTHTHTFTHLTRMHTLNMHTHTLNTQHTHSTPTHTQHTNTPYTQTLTITVTGLEVGRGRLTVARGVGKSVLVCVLDTHVTHCIARTTCMHIKLLTDGKTGQLTYTHKHFSSTLPYAVWLSANHSV